MTISDVSRRACLTAIAAAPFLSPSIAHAQWTVIDPTNLAQNLLQAARALEQINNQIRQIEQQAQMLATSPLQLAPAIATRLNEARALFEAAQQIGFEMEQVGESLRALYPETFAEFSLDDVISRADQWIAESRSSLEVAMRAEAQALAAVRGAQDDIEAALQASSEAQGQTSAAQAGNQLLGVSAAQLAQIQTLLAAQGRALATERMERIAREERGREIRRRAFPSRRRSTPAPARSGL